MMKNVCIDSCVFFHSLEYCDIFDKQGKSALSEKLKLDQQKFQNLIDQLKKVIGPKFLEKYKDVDFDYILPRYKADINSTKSNLEKTIEKTQNCLLGKIKNKDGSIKKVDIPNKRKIELKEKLEDSKKTLETTAKDVVKFQELMDSYRNLRHKYYAGKLFEKMTNGQLHFVVVQDSYNEIQNHCNNGNATDSQYFKYFDSTLIDKMLKHCTVAVLEGDGYANQINALSELYRTSIDGKPCMDKDTNSLGVYGDSRIMAEASILGLDLITLNEKDFITNKSGKLGNSDIRDHIVNVNQNFKKTRNSVKPISPKECIKILEKPNPSGTISP